MKQTDLGEKHDAASVSSTLEVTPVLAAIGKNGLELADGVALSIEGLSTLSAALVAMLTIFDICLENVNLLTLAVGAQPVSVLQDIHIQIGCHIVGFV